jgi:hypothetical protein
MELKPVSETIPVKKNPSSRANKSPEGKLKPAIIPATDKVELVSQHDRDIVLNSIKAKIKQGFYKSEEVTDDISEKLAQLFERA